MIECSDKPNEGLWSRYRFLVVPLLIYLGVLVCQSALTHAFDYSAVQAGSRHPLSPALRLGFRGAVIALVCWLAWGDGRWYWRSAVGFSVLVWIWIVNQACLQASAHSQLNVGLGYHQLLGAPFALLSATMVLVAARLAGGLQFVRPDQSELLRVLPRQFTLAQVLVWLAALGLTLGAIRLVSPPGPNDAMMFGWLKSPEFYEAQLNEILKVAVDVLIVVPTAIVLVYYPRWWPLAVAYFLGVSLAAHPVEQLPWVGPKIFRFYFQKFGYHYTLRVEQAAVTLIPALLLMLAMRAGGYRLTSRWTNAKCGATETTTIADKDS